MRRTPMFSDEADARAVIKRYCVDEADDPVKPADIEFLISRLRPQLWIEAQPSTGAPEFRTCFGGAPDLAEGTAWPIRTVSSMGEFVGDLLKTFGRRVNFADYMKRDVPFEFIAQIDLQEAAKLARFAEGLPTTGRLLFFWDDIVGIYAGGAHACRVIHDETPVDRLAEAKVPAMFDELEQAWRTAGQEEAQQYNESVAKSFPQSEEFMRELGLDEEAIQAAKKSLENSASASPQDDATQKKPFVYPRRAMRLTPTFQLPDTLSAEGATDTDLTRFREQPGGDTCYSVITSLDDGPLRGADYLDVEARRNRLLGLPIPEQDDPRFAMISRKGKLDQPFTREEMAEAGNMWRLLLQVSMADLAQQEREGTVYFLIRKDDLARRDFSGVHAYYQQT
jgi:uncharacterized protein YwqG